MRKKLALIFLVASLFLYGTARTSYAAERTPEELLEKALREVHLYPGEAWAEIDLGYSYHRLGRYEEAVRAFRSALRHSPKNPEAANGAGYALAAMKEHNEAIKYFLKVAELAPSRGDYLSIASSWQALKRYDQALSALKRGDRYADNFERRAEIWNTRGYIFSEMEKHVEAIRCFERAAELLPESADDISIGYAYSAAGEYEKAKKAFKSAIARNEKDIEAHSGLGFACLALKQPEEALEAFSRQEALSPSDSSAFNNLGYARSAAGDQRGAVEAHKKAIEIDPERGDYVSLGYAYSSLGRQDLAEASFREAIKRSPRKREAYDGMGYALAASGRYEKALTAFQRALTLTADARAYTSLGYGYFLLERYDEALEAIRRALSLDPKNADALYNRAMIYLAMGRKDEAMSEYRGLRIIDEKKAMDLLRELRNE